MFEWIRRAFSSPQEPTTSEIHQVLVFYGLSASGVDALPDGQTPSLVLPDLDPEDARRCFAPPASSDFARHDRIAFEALLAALDLNTLRDPNSRGRLAFLQRWLAELEPAEVVWHLEPESTAGDGVSWSRSPN